VGFSAVGLNQKYELFFFFFFFVMKRIENPRLQNLRKI